MSRHGAIIAHTRCRVLIIKMTSQERAQHFDGKVMPAACRSFAQGGNTGPDRTHLLPDMFMLQRSPAYFLVHAHTIMLYAWLFHERPPDVHARACLELRRTCVPFQQHSTRRAAEDSFWGVRTKTRMFSTV